MEVRYRNRRKCDRLRLILARSAPGTAEARGSHCETESGYSRKAETQTKTETKTETKRESEIEPKTETKTEGKPDDKVTAKPEDKAVAASGDKSDGLKTLAMPELLTKLGSSADGLSQAEAQKRLTQYGPNEIAEKKPTIRS